MTGIGARALAVLSLGLLVLAGGSAGAAENIAPGEVVDLSALRVCADPNDLPFSNDRGEGFENQIAELLADHLGVPLTYIWYPRSMGFVRNTLRARLCDVVMGVIAADELMQNTNPYYWSTFVMAIRAEDAGRFVDLDSPAVRYARIGVVAGTQPANLLASRGLMRNVRPYQLFTDSRVAHPIEELIADLVAGEIDIVLGWGPPMGYYAARADWPIRITALEADGPRIRMNFRISMGVRWGEPEWRETLNRAIAVLQPEITRILQAFDVPLLDNQGRMISGVAEVSVDPTTRVATTRAGGVAVPEPPGYRTDRYRSMVPATLEGATVLDTAGLLALLDSTEPILVDVLPKQRPAPGRNAEMPWMERGRAHIPGSVWLPNTGYGELSPDFAAWFEDELARLTGGDPDQPLVFYCDANCWMSWNAAKRAMQELGYHNVYWYPEGVNGWEAAGLDLEAAGPVTMPDFTD